MTPIPSKFTFKHICGDRDYTGVLHANGSVTVTWPNPEAGNESAHYASADVNTNVYRDKNWVEITEVTELPTSDILAVAVAEPVPSLVEQLVALAAAKTYDLTFEPAGAIRLQGMKYGSRGVRLTSVELALQWFGLMDQLLALEAEGS